MLLVWDHTLRNAALAWKANATARRPTPEHMEIDTPLRKGKLPRPEISAPAFAQRVFQTLKNCTG